MTNLCRYDKNGNDVTIYRQDRDEIMFTTYREDYWNELKSQTWRLNGSGYPTCSKLGDLHRYIMGKWYGEDVLKEFTEKGYVVDHLDNEHNNCRINNCRINNLEFLLKDYNTSKGQWLDKETKRLEHHYALAIYKDFNTGLYQITIGMNAPLCRRDEDGEHFIGSIKFLYSEDYPIVIKDAETMLLHLEREEFNPYKYNACAARVYDCPDLKLSEEEKNGAVVERNGKVFLLIGNGQTWISKVAPDKEWIPASDGLFRLQIYKSAVKE